MPSVTMNGTMRSRVTSAPIASPTTAPTATPPRPATSGPTRARSSSHATTTVASAMVDPTDRSIPPATITRVMPSAAMPTMVDCRAMVWRFAAEPKLSGASSANSAYTATSPPNGPSAESHPCQRWRASPLMPPPSRRP
jgi:hypothetical protein